VGERIADLVKSIDPNYVIDPEAEEQVLQLADDFLEKVTRQAIRLAQHRGSTIVDVQDLQIVLAKNFGIVIPGMGFPNIRPVKSTTATSTVSSKGSIGTKGTSSTVVDGPTRKKSNTISGMAAAAAAAAAPSASSSKT
jgi:transcription initiation factor TFIID subunit TAF12